jgi:hypothetical protein
VKPRSSPALPRFVRFGRLKPNAFRILELEKSRAAAREFRGFCNPKGIVSHNYKGCEERATLGGCRKGF